MSLHHLHTRKRFSGKTIHSYPAGTRTLRLLDKIVYAAGFIAILMMLPQLRLIFVEKDAGGLLPLTWITLALLNIPWIVYGFVHKERPIVIVYTLWIVVNILVFVGAVLY